MIDIFESTQLPDLIAAMANVCIAPYAFECDASDDRTGEIPTCSDVVLEIRIEDTDSDLVEFLEAVAITGGEADRLPLQLKMPVEVESWSATANVYEMQLRQGHQIVATDAEGILKNWSKGSTIRFRIEIDFEF